MEGGLLECFSNFAYFLPKLSVPFSVKCNEGCSSLDKTTAEWSNQRKSPSPMKPFTVPYVDKFWILLFLSPSSPLSVPLKCYKGYWATNFLHLRNPFWWMTSVPCHGNTCIGVVSARKSADSYLTCRCWMRICCWYFPSVMQRVFPPCVGVCRCGTTLWPRQPRTGLLPACGSTGHLTSSGSWVRTSPSGQDGEWPLTPPSPPPPPPSLTSAAPLRDDSLSLSSHGRCPAAPFFSPLKVFALWPGDCLRNAPVTLHINKRCVSSHDPWGQRRIPLVGLDFPFGNTGHLHVFYTLRFYWGAKTRDSREFVCWRDLVTHTESAIGRISSKKPSKLRWQEFNYQYRFKSVGAHCWNVFYCIPTRQTVNNVHIWMFFILEGLHHHTTKWFMSPLFPESRH